MKIDTTSLVKFLVRILCTLVVLFVAGGIWTLSSVALKEANKGVKALFARKPVAPEPPEKSKPSDEKTADELLYEYVVYGTVSATYEQKMKVWREKMKVWRENRSRISTRLIFFGIPGLFGSVVCLLVIILGVRFVWGYNSKWDFPFRQRTN